MVIEPVLDTESILYKTVHCYWLEKLPYWRKGVIQRLKDIGEKKLASEISKCGKTKNHRCNNYFLCPICQLERQHRDINMIEKAQQRMYAGNSMAAVKFVSPYLGKFDIYLKYEFVKMHFCFKSLLKSDWFNHFFTGFFKSFSLEQEFDTGEWNLVMNIISPYHKAYIGPSEDLIMFSKKFFDHFNTINSKKDYTISYAETRLTEWEKEAPVIATASIPMLWKDELIEGITDRDFKYYVKEIIPVFATNYKIGGAMVLSNEVRGKAHWWAKPLDRIFR